MKRIVRVACAISGLGLVLSALPAAAEQKMNFRQWHDKSGAIWGQGSRDYIFGDGEITADTPAALKVALFDAKAHPGTVIVFNSPGGDMMAAMEMGRIIREQKLWTEVGAFLPTYLGLSPNLDQSLVPYVRRPVAPPFPGYCYSACTLAMLGGVVRTVRAASDYGVHRFHLEKQPDNGVDIGQQGAAEIIEYLSRMGVDAGFLTEMAKKGSNDVTHLSQKRMAELKIITPTWETSWQFRSQTDANSRIYFLEGDVTDGWGEHQINVYCPIDETQRATRALVMMDVFVETGGRVDPSEFAKGVGDYIFEMDDESDFLPAEYVVKKAAMSPSTHRIGSTIALPPGVVKALANSRYFAFALINVHTDVELLQVTATMDPDKLLNLAQQCPQPPPAPSK